MNGPAMDGTALIRAALAAALLVAAGQAQAGNDVPPPRAIRPTQPVFAAATPMDFAAPRRWREAPPVIESWSPDRHIPVVGFDQADVCDDDWADEGDEFADFDRDDFAPEPEMMR